MYNSEIVMGKWDKITITWMVSQIFQNSLYQVLTKSYPHTLQNWTHIQKSCKICRSFCNDLVRFNYGKKANHSVPTSFSLVKQQGLNPASHWCYSINIMETPPPPQHKTAARLWVHRDCHEMRVQMKALALSMDVDYWVLTASVKEPLKTLVAHFNLLQYSAVSRLEAFWRRNKQNYFTVENELSNISLFECFKYSNCFKLELAYVINLVKCHNQKSIITEKVLLRRKKEMVTGQ